MAVKRMSWSLHLRQFRPQIERSSRHSVSTSVRGRFQFSTENAYSVSACNPSRAQVSTVTRTAGIPACARRRGAVPRRLAQRPLPSMMMAMCAGSRAGSIGRAKAYSAEPGFNTSSSLDWQLDHGSKW